MRTSSCSNHANEHAEAARRKPKLGTFSRDTCISNDVALKPSVFAINKLRDMKYVELYCFTPAGCRDHAKQRITSADEVFGFSYGISPDGSVNNFLTLKPVSALSHPRKTIPDENLTWEQVRDAKACFLSHIMEAGWDQEHVDALALFFINLDNHPFINNPEGKQALVWYQAHARDDWHRKLGTPDSYNISILNDTLLALFKKKADDLSIQNNVALVSQFCLPAHSHLADPCPHRLTQPTRIIPTPLRHVPRNACTCTMHLYTVHARSSLAQRPTHHAHPQPLLPRPHIHAPPRAQCTCVHACIHQLTKQLNEATALLARVSSTGQTRPTQSRSKAGRYQPYGTGTGSEAMK